MPSTNILLYGVCTTFNLYLLTIVDSRLLATTWTDLSEVDSAWEFGTTALDTTQAACRFCESNQCRGSVGFGGHPDEQGEVTQDALVMDGRTMKVGAVAALRNIKNAVDVARYVLDYTEHSMLAGDQATEFALGMSNENTEFKFESLSTETSNSTNQTWTAGNCQPNFRKNVTPKPETSCGPYTPI